MTNLILLFASLTSLTPSSGATSPDAVPPGATSPDAAGPGNNAMHKPEPIVHKSDEGQRLLQGIAAVLDEKLSSGDRRRLGTKVLSQGRVSMIRGNFDAAGTVLVAVNVNLRPKNPDDPATFIAGLFTLTADGSLASMVIAPAMRTERYDVESIGDQDGDGKDDFVYVVTGNANTERRRVTWGSEGPKTTTLGDSA